MTGTADSMAIRTACVLYVYRCAVYFAQTPDPDPEKCKWWNWKDEAVETER